MFTVCITIHSPWRHCHGILSWAFGHFGHFDGDLLGSRHFDGDLREGQSEVTAKGGADAFFEGMEGVSAPWARFLFFCFFEIVFFLIDPF